MICAHNVIDRNEQLCSNYARNTNACCPYVWVESSESEAECDGEEKTRRDSGRIKDTRNQVRR